MVMQENLQDEEGLKFSLKKRKAIENILISCYDYSFNIGIIKLGNVYRLNCIIYM